MIKVLKFCLLNFSFLFFYVSSYQIYNLERSFSTKNVVRIRSHTYNIMCKNNNEIEDDDKIEIEFDLINADQNNKNGLTQGYLNTDIKKMGTEKKSRVLAYILLALLPCLFLVPFFMSRDFVPPTDM